LISAWIIYVQSNIQRHPRFSPSPPPNHIRSTVVVVVVVAS
jgi:hypothetical protein